MGILPTRYRFAAGFVYPARRAESRIGQFSRPLDLLLYLIRKQNIDVLDIPMVEITGQYLHYIAQMEAYQFDLAAEYLLMAAMLIEIKSRLLLPRTEAVEDEECSTRVPSWCAVCLPTSK